MPYIDPITGAIIDDPMEALPPGSNMPSPRQMRAELSVAPQPQAITEAPKSSSIMDKFLNFQKLIHGGISNVAPLPSAAAN